MVAQLWSVGQPAANLNEPMSGFGRLAFYRLSSEERATSGHVLARITEETNARDNSQ